MVKEHSKSIVKTNQNGDRERKIGTKKKQEEEWSNAGISCGSTVTIAETTASNRNLLAISTREGETGTSRCNELEGQRPEDR